MAELVSNPPDDNCVLIALLTLLHEGFYVFKQLCQSHSIKLCSFIKFARLEHKKLFACYLRPRFIFKGP